MALGMAVGLSPGHILLDGDPAVLPKKGGHSPQFSSHVYCGQTAAWIKMLLGMEAGLGPGDIVVDWHAAPLPRKKGPSPHFRPMSIAAKRCMHQGWYGGRP